MKNPKSGEEVCVMQNLDLSEKEHSPFHENILLRKGRPPRELTPKTGVISKDTLERSYL